MHKRIKIPFLDDLNEKLNKKVEAVSKGLNEGIPVIKQINDFGEPFINILRKIDAFLSGTPIDSEDKSEKTTRKIVKEDVFCDDLFFKEMKYRGRFKRGLIKFIKSCEENSVFFKKYKEKAKINGFIDRGFLDSIPNKEKILRSSREDFNDEDYYESNDNKKDYSSILMNGRLEFDCDAKIMFVIKLVERMELEIAKDFNKAVRQKGSKPFIKDAWLVALEWLKHYNKLISRYDCWGELDERKIYKLLYYGSPATISYSFFYILTRMNIDVIVLTPQDYDYRNYAPAYMWNVIEKNVTIPRFDNQSSI